MKRKVSQLRKIFELLWFVSRSGARGQASGRERPSHMTDLASAPFLQQWWSCFLEVSIIYSFLVLDADIPKIRPHKNSEFGVSRCLAYVVDSFLCISGSLSSWADTRNLSSHSTGFLCQHTSFALSLALLVDHKVPINHHELPLGSSNKSRQQKLWQLQWKERSL